MSAANSCSDPGDDGADAIDVGLLIGAVKGLAQALREGVDVGWLPGGDVARWVAGQRLSLLGDRDGRVAADRLALAADAASCGDVALERIWAADAAEVAAMGGVFQSVAADLRADRVPVMVPVQGLAALQVLCDADGRLSVVWALRSSWGWLWCGPTAVNTWSAAVQASRPEVVDRLSAALVSLPSPAPGWDLEDLGLLDSSALLLLAAEREEVRCAGRVAGPQRQVPPHGCAAYGQCQSGGCSPDDDGG